MTKSCIVLLSLLLFLLVKTLIAQPPPPSGQIKYNVVRELYELNVNGTANVYPYISPDGLRIYYSQGISSNPFDMKYEKLYMASRKNNKTEFSNPQLVSNLFPDSVRSCWLTNDELEIFYTSGNQSGTENSRLFHATRASLTSPFSQPEQVLLNGMVFTNNWNMLIAPSLTPDKQELYLYNTVYLGGSPHTYSILRFTREDENIYTLQDTLARDLLKVPTAGQLSKDGKRFFFGYINNSSDTLRLCVLERDTISQKFDGTSFQVLVGKIKTQHYFNWQPSITADYGTVAFVREFQGGWNSNLLYIAMDTTIKEGIENISAGSKLKISAYPNPSNTFIKIVSNKDFNDASISIYNTLGIEVRRYENVFGKSIVIYKNELDEGMYFYSVKNKNTILAKGKLLLQ